MAEIARQAFELSRSGDPVASRAGWTPMNSGGYPTHRLLRVNVSRMEFRASMAARLLFLLGLAAGLVVLVGSASSAAMVEFRLEGMVAGLLLIVAAVTLFHYATAPVVLDKRLGRVRRGRRSSLPLLRRFAVPQSVALADVYAVQLLGRLSGQSRDFSAYEINLVLESGERLNVFEHRSEAVIRADGRLLSVFLGKPVWDGIS